jgi:hypothetical protein
MRNKMITVGIAQRGKTDVSVKLSISAYCAIGIKSGKGGDGVHEYCEALLKGSQERGKK